MQVTDSMNEVRLFMEGATDDTHAVFNDVSGMLGNLL